MSNKNEYLALKETENEPEYQVNPPLKISSIGTEIKKNSSIMPDGSALLTDTGNNSSLKNQGINYIIHAVPRMRSSCASDEEFIKIATKAAQNSIILADREGINTLAICLIGGKIYLGSASPDKLAEAIIIGSLHQMKKCGHLGEIVFVDYDGDYYGKALAKIKSEPFGPDNTVVAEVKKGDLCQKNIHKAQAIVNSENAEMEFRSGISGAIKTALGTEATKVDQQRKDLMKKFNDLINVKQGNDNKEKISRLFRYGSRGGLAEDSEGNWTSFFFLHDTKAGTSSDISIEIRDNHPTLVKHASRQFWKIPEDQNKYKTIKLTWYKSKEKETGYAYDYFIFEKDDFIEIEEIKSNDNGNNDNGNQNGNGNGDQNNNGGGGGNNQGPTSNGSDNTNDANKNPDHWREKLKTTNEGLEQVFDDDKVNEWQQEKGPLNTAEGVKKLLESVKDNPDFLQEINSKHSAPDLNNLVNNKSPRQVITIIERFKYDKLNADDKKNKDKKIRKHYNLKETDTLTDDQINDFVYMVANGEIDENSLTEKEQDTIKPEEGNILKIVGIGSLVLFGIVLFALFLRSRKRKKVVKRTIKNI